jgi:hypothetical protein
MPSRAIGFCGVAEFVNDDRILGDSRHLRGRDFSLQFCKTNADIPRHFAVRPEFAKVCMSELRILQSFCAILPLVTVTGLPEVATVP